MANTEHAPSAADHGRRRRIGPGKAAQPTHAPDRRAWLLIADVLALGAGLLVTSAVQRPLGLVDAPALIASQSNAYVLATYAVLVLMSLGAAHQYREGRRFDPIDDLWAVARASFVAASIVVFLTVLSGASASVPGNGLRTRIVFAVFVPGAVLGAVRIAAFARQRRAFLEGRYLKRVLVVGGGRRAGQFVWWIHANPHLGYLVERSEIDRAHDPADVARIMGAEIAQFGPDEIVLALDHPGSELGGVVVREAAFHNLNATVHPEVFESYTDLPLSEYDGVPVTEAVRSPRDRVRTGAKRAMDLAVSWVAMVLCAPVFGAIALAIWLDDRGPVFYSQERVGERGRRFLVHKFRTMCVDADRRQSELAPMNESDGPLFKMRDDPRVTRVGRVLRRLSLDELPQLWNVATAEMSIVGPRPPLPSEVGEYRMSHRRRLLVRPGITGMWQVSGRSDTSFDTMVNLDRWYIDNWSLVLDLRIMLKTVTVVLSRKGAY